MRIPERNRCGHSIAYLLDPRYLRHQMTLELRNEVEKYILDCYFNENSLLDEENQRRKMQVISEYQNFKDAIIFMKNTNSFMYKCLIDKIVSVYSFWLIQSA